MQDEIWAVWRDVDCRSLRLRYIDNDLSQSVVILSIFPESIAILTSRACNRMKASEVLYCVDIF